MSSKKLLPVSGLAVLGRAEWQLVFFTTLTQAAVGAFTWWGLAVLFPLPPTYSTGTFAGTLLLITLIWLVLGTLAATLHLGRPARAWFALSHLRSSWLSREAILGGSFGLLVAFLLLRRLLGAAFTGLDRILVLGGILAGLSLVYSISRLYRLRTVPAWDHAGTPATFYTTTLLLGLVTIGALWNGLVLRDDGYAIEGLFSLWMVFLPVALMVLTLVQWGIFGAVLLHLSRQGRAAAASLRLLATDLRPVLLLRGLTALLALGLLALPRLFYFPLNLWGAFGLLFISEILGRFLFYGFYRRMGI